MKGTSPSRPGLDPPDDGRRQDIAIDSQRLRAQSGSRCRVLRRQTSMGRRHLDARVRICLPSGTAVGARRVFRWRRAAAVAAGIAGGRSMARCGDTARRRGHHAASRRPTLRVGADRRSRHRRADSGRAGLRLRGMASGRPSHGRAAGRVGGHGHCARRHHRRIAASLGARHTIRVRRGAHGDPGGDRAGAVVARLVCAMAEGRFGHSGSQYRGRRALAARRSAQAAARHREPAWLRRRSVASRERPAGDRLRAHRRSQRAPGCVRGPRSGLRPACPREHPRAHRRRATRCAVRGRDRRSDDRRPARDSGGAMARLQSHRHRAPDQHLRAPRDGVRDACRRRRVRSRGGAWH